MKVILQENVYEMNGKQFHGILKIAKDSVKMGIYAVEKQGIVEMKNETFENKEELNKIVDEYTKKGFKVYFNG